MVNETGFQLKVITVIVCLMAAMTQILQRTCSRLFMKGCLLLECAKGIALCILVTTKYSGVLNM